MSTVAITPVTKAEVPALLALIRELASYENLEDEVVASVGSLEDSLFGPRPSAGALLARCDGEIAGYAIYFFTFSSFVGREGIWLEDLYVRPAFRKHGLGRGLIEAVAKVGVERNCHRFEWTALDWNELALNFYEKLGAQRLDKWVLMRTQAKALLDLGKVAE